MSLDRQKPIYPHQQRARDFASQVEAVLEDKHPNAYQVTDLTQECINHADKSSDRYRAVIDESVNLWQITLFFNCIGQESHCMPQLEATMKQVQSLAVEYLGYVHLKPNDHDEGMAEYLPDGEADFTYYLGVNFKSVKTDQKTK